MVDYRYLKAFKAASKSLNFAKAAQELRISPSALSRQISLLEQGLKKELFIRNTRQVSLTPFGQKLYGSMDRFDEELAGLEVEPALRIGCLQSVFEFFLVPLMKKHPKVFDGPLDIEVGTPSALNLAVLAGDLDVAITNLKPSGSSVSVFKLFQEAIAWVEDGSKKNSRTILFSAFEHQYSKAEISSLDRIRVNSFHAAVELTKHGLGKTLAAYPTFLQRRGPKRDTQWIYAILPQYKRIPPKLENLVRILKQQDERL